MSLLSTIRFIANHPVNKGNKSGAVLRFIKWQLSTKLNPYPVIYPLTRRSNLIIKKGMTGATGNLYCGLHEYNDMLFLLHFLREADLFVDIGANIGSYTVLAAAHVGANTISFEPVPSTFTNLENNIYINQINQRVKAFNVALGGEKGNIAFTSTQDTVNHVATSADKDTIMVPVEVLDEILENNKPTLLKIDVEGFETEVLNGASKTLANLNLKAIIIELNGSGSRYGYNENAIHEKLMGLGFQSFAYDPLQRKLLGLQNSSLNYNNTIYVRDLAFVEERLKSAEKIEVLGKTF